MPDFKLDKEKSAAALLYIIEQLGGSWGMYSLLKILYFAESKHLAEYGRPITGDFMVAMPYGPVPSYSYDSVKPAYIDAVNFENIDDIIIAKQKPNLDLLSESDIECLNVSISENSKLSFGRLKDKSHDAAYNITVQKSGINSTIPFIEIAKASGANENMIQYITTYRENLNASF